MKKNIFTFVFILLSQVVYAQTPAEQATANYFATIQTDPTQLALSMKQGEHCGKQCAAEEPAIGVRCWAKQATHHAVKSWWEAWA